VPFFTPLSTPVIGSSDWTVHRSWQRKLGPTWAATHFTAPRVSTLDLSMVKKFQVTERVSAQFRMDAFNIFNHPFYCI